MEVTYTWIDQPEEFRNFLEKVKEAPVISLDTEADNMHHYETRLCLLQVGLGEDVGLIDPMNGLSWTDLLPILEDKELVMHGSDFDFRLLTLWGGFRPRQLFDTMHAAQLLGLPRIGLGSLAEQYLGLEMAKTHQKSDWSKRPLTPMMLHYAALDAHILHEIKAIMAREIEERGLSAWLSERCQWQIEIGNQGFAEKKEGAWRIGAWKKLKERGLVNLYLLHQWREEMARKMDRPPFKVINNEFLFRVAKEGESYPAEDWKSSLTPRLLKARGKELEKILARAESFDPRDLPGAPARQARPEPFTNEELQQQEALQKVRDDEAQKLGIDPSLIANRQQLAELVRRPEDAGRILLPTPRRLLGLGD